MDMTNINLKELKDSDKNYEKELFLLAMRGKHAPKELRSSFSQTPSSLSRGFRLSTILKRKKTTHPIYATFITYN